MIRLELKNCNGILTEKQQKYQHYHPKKQINRNILQVKKYYLLIEQAKFAYSHLRKAFEKQTKTIEEQGKKSKLKLQNPEEEKNQLKNFFPKGVRTNEIKNEIHEIKKWEEKVRRKDVIFKANKYKYDFQQYETIRSFGDTIYNGKTNKGEAEIDRSSLLDGL